MLQMTVRNPRKMVPYFALLSVIGARLPIFPDRLFVVWDDTLGGATVDMSVLAIGFLQIRKAYEKDLLLSEDQQSVSRMANSLVFHLFTYMMPPGFDSQRAADLFAMEYPQGDIRHFQESGARMSICTYVLPLTV
jgi:hypothetical protein